MMTTGKKFMIMSRGGKENGYMMDLDSKKEMWMILSVHRVIENGEEPEIMIVEGEEVYYTNLVWERKEKD